MKAPLTNKNLDPLNLNNSKIVAPEVLLDNPFEDVNVSYYYNQRGMTLDPNFQKTVETFGFTRPSSQSIIEIVTFLEENNATKIVSIGAGLGYVENLFSQVGCDVKAFDINADTNAKTWYPVEYGDHRIIPEYIDYTLLICSPDKGKKNSNYALKALESYYNMGGRFVIHMGATHPFDLNNYPFGAPEDFLDFFYRSLNELKSWDLLEWPGKGYKGKARIFEVP